MFGSTDVVDGLDQSPTQHLKDSLSAHSGRDTDDGVRRSALRTRRTLSWASDHLRITTFVRVTTTSPSIASERDLDSRVPPPASREDLSALGDLSNDYLAKKSWWQDVKTTATGPPRITAKQASDKARHLCWAEAEEKFDGIYGCREKDRMCTDIHKAEALVASDNHCSTGAVQASRLGFVWSVAWSSWSPSIIHEKSCRSAQKRRPRPRKPSGGDVISRLRFTTNKNAHIEHVLPRTRATGAKLVLICRPGKPYRNRWWHVGITGVDESRKYFKCLGTYCNPPIGREYYFPDKRTNKCTERVVIERKDTWGRLKSATLGVGNPTT